MPTNQRYRRQERRQRYTGLDPELKRTLLYGTPFFGLPDLEIVRQAWQEHGEDLLAEWIEERPGSRPFAWWLFEAIPKHGERRTLPGFPEEYRDNWLTFDILHTDVFPAMQESEEEYLDRHGLLSVEERRLLKTKQSLAARCGEDNP
jgi:hypothetical protein